jgi:RNA binding exosome subunit
LVVNIVPLNQTISPRSINSLNNLNCSEYLQYIDSDIEKKNTEGHAGDFHISIQTKKGKKGKIIIDAKQYTRAVPKKEREKLLSDLDHDDNRIAAMMISLTSKVATMKHLEIELSGKNKPVIYCIIENMTDDLAANEIKGAISILSSICDINDSNKRDYYTNYKTFYLIMCKKRDAIKNALQKQMSAFSEDLVTVLETLESPDDGHYDSSMSVEIVTKDATIPQQICQFDDVNRCEAISKQTKQRCRLKKTFGVYCNNHKIEKS